MTNGNLTYFPQVLARCMMVAACGVLMLGVSMAAVAQSSEAPVSFVDNSGQPVEPSGRTVTPSGRTVELSGRPVHLSAPPVAAERHVQTDLKSSPPVTHAPVRSADEPASPAGGRETLFTLQATKSSVDFARSGIDRRLMTVTAYCPCKICCGKNARGVTASGKKVGYNKGRFVAADTSVLPFGTRVRVPGYNCSKPVEVIDRGGAIVGNSLDVFFKTHKQAAEWGRKTIWVDVLR